MRAASRHHPVRRRDDGRNQRFGSRSIAGNSRSGRQTSRWPEQQTKWRCQRRRHHHQYARRAQSKIWLIRARIQEDVNSGRGQDYELDESPDTSSPHLDCAPQSPLESLSLRLGDAPSPLLGITNRILGGSSFTAYFTSRVQVSRISPAICIQVL